MAFPAADRPRHRPPVTCPKFFHLAVAGPNLAAAARGKFAAPLLVTEQRIRGRATRWSTQISGGGLCPRRCSRENRQNHHKNETLQETHLRSPRLLSAQRTTIRARRSDRRSSSSLSSPKPGTVTRTRRCPQDAHCRQCPGSGPLPFCEEIARDRNPSVLSGKFTPMD